MAKLSHQEFREAYPNATITAWVRYRYCNGRLPEEENFKIKYELTDGYHLNQNPGELYGLPTVKDARCATLKKIDTAGFTSLKLNYTSKKENTVWMYSLFKNDVCQLRQTSNNPGDTILLNDADYAYISFYSSLTVLVDDVDNIKLTLN